MPFGEKCGGQAANQFAFFEIAVRAISRKIYSKFLQGGQQYAYYQSAHQER
jgi:hypothetical protein